MADTLGYFLKLPLKNVAQLFIAKTLRLSCVSYYIMYQARNKCSVLYSRYLKGVSTFLVKSGMWKGEGLRAKLSPPPSNELALYKLSSFRKTISHHIHVTTLNTDQTLFFLPSIQLRFLLMIWSASALFSTAESAHSPSCPRRRKAPLPSAPNSRLAVRLKHARLLGSLKKSWAKCATNARVMLLMWSSSAQYIVLPNRKRLMWDLAPSSKLRVAAHLPKTPVESQYFARTTLW